MKEQQKSLGKIINGCMQFIRYRGQSKTYKNAKEHENGHIKHRKGPVRYDVYNI